MYLVFGKKMIQSGLILLHLVLLKYNLKLIFKSDVQ